MLASVPCLVQVVNDAFSRDDFSAGFLSRYQKSWKKAIGRELKNGFRLRSMYNNIYDDELNRIRRIVDRPSIKELASNATIDNPSAMVLKALKNVPMTLRLMPYLFKGLFR